MTRSTLDYFIAHTTVTSLNKITQSLISATHLCLTLYSAVVTLVAFNSLRIIQYDYC